MRSAKTYERKVFRLDVSSTKLYEYAPIHNFSTVYAAAQLCTLMVFKVFTLI